MNADDNSAVRQAVSETVTIAEDSGAATRRRARTPKLYRVCDGVTEGLIYFGVVFTPWAFGTTQNWTIWTMNVVCYLLGAALIMKWGIRWRTGYPPPRLGEDFTEAGGGRPAVSCQRTVVSSQRSKVRSQRRGRWSVRRKLVFKAEKKWPRKTKKAQMLFCAFFIFLRERLNGFT